MLSLRTALVFTAVLLWIAGLTCVWYGIPIVPVPLDDFDRIGRIYLLNGALAFGLVLTPAAIVIGAWLRHGRGWRRALDAPMLWALGGIVLLATNAVSEIVLPGSGAPHSTAMEEAIYLVGQFRYVLQLSAVFAGFTAFYFFFSTIMGWTYSAVLARLHFGFHFIGANLGLLPFYFYKFLVPSNDYGETYSRVGLENHLIDLSKIITACGLLIFAGLLIQAFMRQRPVAAEY